MLLSEKECAELRASSRSGEMRSDLARVAASRHNPFGEGGETDADAVMEFLTRYNEFLNHPMKPSRTFIEKNMKL